MWPIPTLLNPSSKNTHTHDFECDEQEALQLLKNVNSKVLFWETFSADQLPVVSELKMHLTTEFHLPDNRVEEAITSISPMYMGVIDDNAFSAAVLFLKLTPTDITDVALLQSYAFPGYSTGNTRRNTQEFVCNTQCFLYERCHRFSSRKYTTTEKLRKLYTKLENCPDGATITRSLLHDLTFEASKRLQFGLTICDKQEAFWCTVIALLSKEASQGPGGTSSWYD